MENAYKKDLLKQSPPWEGLVSISLCLDSLRVLLCKSVAASENVKIYGSDQKPNPTHKDNKNGSKMA